MCGAENFERHDDAGDAVEVSAAGDAVDVRAAEPDGLIPLNLRRPRMQISRGVDADLTARSLGLLGDVIARSSPVLRKSGAVGAPIVLARGGARDPVNV